MTDIVNIRYEKDGSTWKKKIIDSFAVEIGRRIKTYRKLANLSQGDLGQTLNVTSQQIHKYENGSNEISFKKLCLIAMSLDVPIDYLIDDIIYLLNDNKQDSISNKYYQNKKNLKYLVEISRYLNNMDEATKQRAVDFIKTMT